MHRYFILIIILFSVTKIASADVIINEIAWMGTNTSANDEWIELHNNGTASVPIDGWSLKAADGSPEINLTGTISAGGYFLLERTDDTSVPNIPAGVIYSGALSNTGESLILKNNTEQVIDTVDMSSGWSAGNSSSKQTMQRTNAGTWITAAATPGAENATINTGGNNSGDTTTENTNSNSTTITPEEDTTAEDTVIKIDPNPVYSARMVLPQIFVQQVPMHFDSEVKRDGKFNDLRGRFEWSMGDGGSFVFNRNTPFDYTYQEPGTYVIMLRYYSDVFKEKPDTIHQKTITVIPAAITTKENHLTGSIELTNTSTDDIDLGGWQLQKGTSSFTFPLYTILTKDNTIKISRSTHALPNTRDKLILMTPNHFVIGNSVPRGSATAQAYAADESTPDDSANTDKDLFIQPASINTVPIAKTDSKSLVFLLVFILIITGSLYGMKHLFDIPATTHDSEI